MAYETFDNRPETGGVGSYSSLMGTGKGAIDHNNVM